MRRAVLVLLLWLGACGDEEAIIVKVDTSRFQIPQQIDLLHLEVKHTAEAVIGRNVPLAADQTNPAIKLIAGGRLPRQGLILIVYGFLGATLVIQSAEQQIGFESGKTKVVNISL